MCRFAFWVYDWPNQSHVVVYIFVLGSYIPMSGAERGSMCVLAINPVFV